MGASPHTPVSLIRATKGSAFGNRQLFEKSWAKTCGEPPQAFSLLYLLITFFIWLDRIDYLVLSVNKIKLTNLVEPVNKTTCLTKPPKAACNEMEAAACRKKLDQNFYFGDYRISIRIHIHLNSLEITFSNLPVKLFSSVQSIVSG